MVSFTDSIILTSNSEPIQFNKHILLIPEQPRKTSFIKLGCEVDPAGAHALLAGCIVNGEVVSEWLVLKMGESREDWPTRSEVHSTG